MKLSSRLMSAAAIASLLVAVGANSGDAGNVPAVTAFTLTFPGMDLRGPAGGSVSAFPTASWHLGAGLDFTDAFLFGECCTPNEGTCSFQATGVSNLSSFLFGLGSVDAPINAVGGPMMLPTPNTAGQTTAYVIVLKAHCSVLSATFKFAPVYSSATATAVYRVTAQ
jgi:hypothetical protein